MSLAVQEGDDEVRVRVPAKINLALLVGPRRLDGYHELATIFQAVSLYDEVAASAGEGEDVTCQVTGPDALRVGPADQNLAVKAARLLQNEYGVTEPVHLTIDKRIPIAGGMAGGSADAAGALLACARFWGLDASAADLAGLGSRLGADVPFALMGGCALGLGRGEALTPTLSRGRCHWVLAFSERGLATPEVYARFDRLATTRPAVPQAPQELMMALTSGDMARIGALLANDLQEAACSLRPELAGLIAAGTEAGTLGTIVSGSGPTVAFLTADEQAATELALALSEQGVAHRIRLAHGPVAGASLVRG